MLSHKHITKLVILLTAAAAALCLTAMVFAGQLTERAGGTGVSMEYETALFASDEMISVNIIMDEDKWQEMLDGATQEVYYECNAEINGQMFYRVGIRPKGNTSLTTIAADPTTDRYSFKLEFDQFVDGQTCFGLDKLILNNNYADATNMKEALIYDMYHTLGADSSLTGYATVSVNGEYRGLYLALEAVEDSFLLRNYGVSSGELYKPETMDFGDGMSGMMGGGGANLNYSDDDPDSYSTIWDGEVTHTSAADHKRVVTALRHISEGTDLEKYMDIDNLLRYMAVHVFSVNSDSLSGMMAHNYYLYEEDGRLNILPWDYNLSLGGMGGGDDATSVVNDAIDNAFSGTRFFDTLMQNEEYHSRYYAYLQQLVDNYILGDGFEDFYQRTRSQIDELVKTDPTAFYSYDEYETAADTLYQVVRLRGESIRGQLDGTIPSDAAEQRSSENLIDASSVSLSVMGSMDAGGNKGSGGFDPAQAGGQMPEGFDPAQAGGQMPKNFDPTQAGGQMPGNVDPTQDGGQMPENFSNPTNPDEPQEQTDAAQSIAEASAAVTDLSQNTEELPSDVAPTQSMAETPEGFDFSGADGKKPGGFSPFQGGGQTPGGFGSEKESSVLRNNALIYGICLLILFAALLFVKLYHRRGRRR